MAVILAKKVGMTQRFEEDGTVVRMTVLQAGPCYVTALRNPARDGYEAVQLGFEEVPERKLTKAELGHLKRAGVPPLCHLAEFRAPIEGLKLGDQVTVSAFSVGEKVKVSGTTKGKGFQGTIARHGFKRGPKTHGSHNIRAPGSIGAAAFPSRVFKGLRMAGQLGARRATQRALTVVGVDEQRNLLLVRGAVPGPRNGLVEVRSDG